MARAVVIKDSEGVIFTCADRAVTSDIPIALRDAWARQPEGIAAFILPPGIYLAGIAPAPETTT